MNVAKTNKAVLAVIRQRFPGLLGDSIAMKEFLSTLEIVAGHETFVLLYGEAGTEKENVTQAIHALSSKSSLSFYKYHCSASKLPALFKNGKSGELKRIGTLFLDEICELSLTEQTQFVDYFSNEKNKTGIRVVGATSKDPEAKVREGSIREEFFYLLNVFPLKIPPLRDRGEDLKPLIYYFIEKINQETNTAVQEVSEEAMNSLLSYSWPANSRELEHVLRRACLLCPGNTLTAEQLPFTKQKGETKNSVSPTSAVIKTLPEMVEELERKMISQALEKTEGNQSRAAKLLGLTPRIFAYKMKMYSIEKR